MYTNYHRLGLGYVENSSKEHVRIVHLYGAINDLCRLIMYIVQKRTGGVSTVRPSAVKKDTVQGKVYTCATGSSWFGTRSILVLTTKNNVSTSNFVIVVTKDFVCNI